MHARIIILRCQLFGSDIFRNRQHTFISIFKLLSKWVNSCIVRIVSWRMFHLVHTCCTFHLTEPHLSSDLKYWEPRPWDGVVHPRRKNHYERLCCPCRLNTESFGIVLTALIFTTTSDFRARFREVYPRRRTSVDVVYRQLTDKLCFITVPNTCNTCTFALASTHITVKAILEMDIFGAL